MYVLPNVQSESRNIYTDCISSQKLPKKIYDDISILLKNVHIYLKKYNNWWKEMLTSAGITTTYGELDEARDYWERYINKDYLADQVDDLAMASAAKSGCRKCTNELATGVKTKKGHDDGCPRKQRRRLS